MGKPRAIVRVEGLTPELTVQILSRDIWDRIRLREAPSTNASYIIEQIYWQLRSNTPPRVQWVCTRKDRPLEVFSSDGSYF